MGPAHVRTLEVYDFNPRARHAYEEVGFVHEGTGRDQQGPAERESEAALCGTFSARDAEKRPGARGGRHTRRSFEK